MLDRIHMSLSVPSKFSIAFIIGFLKGKSAIRIYREILKLKRPNFSKYLVPACPGWVNSWFCGQ